MTPNDTNNDKRIQRRSYYIPEFKALVNSEYKDPAAIRQAYMTANLNRSKTEFVLLEDIGLNTEDDFRNRLLTGLKNVGLSVANPLLDIMRGGAAAASWMADNMALQKMHKLNADDYIADKISKEEYLARLNDINSRAYEKLRQESIADGKIMRETHDNFLKAVGLANDERDRPGWATGGQVVGSVLQSMVGGVFLKSPKLISTLWGLSQANQSWEEALENGKSRARAVSLAIPNGVLNALIEQVGLDWIGKAFKANKPLNKILISFLSEGGEELAQGVVDETLMQKLGGREKEFEDTVKDLYASFLIGGIAGGTLAGGHVAFGKLVDMAGANKAAEIAQRIQAAAASAPAQAEAAKMIWRQEHPANFPNDSAKQAIDQTKAQMLKQDKKTQLEDLAAQKEAMLKEAGASDEEARAGSLIAANIINNIAISKGITPELANGYLNLQIERQDQADVKSGLEKADSADNSFDLVLGQAAAMYKKKAKSIAEFSDFAIKNKNNADTSNKSYYQIEGEIKIDVPFERANHIHERHSLSREQWLELENNLKRPQAESFALLPKSPSQYNGTKIMFKMNTAVGKAGVVLEVTDGGRVFLDTAFFDKEKNIDNWIKKSPSVMPTQSAVSNGRGKYNIQQIIEKIKGNKNYKQDGQETEDIYYQAKRGVINLSKRGGVYQALISVMRQGDRSTILHELGHLWLYTAQDIYSKAEFNELRADLDAWIGKPKIKDGRFVYTEKQQEKLAKGLETYLTEGKAPAPALKAVFDKIHEWFLQIYNGALVDMSDEGRRVYDRMFTLAGAAAEENLTLYQDAAKNKKVRSAIKQLREKGKLDIEGLSLKDIENYLQILDMGAPPLPKATLITYLRKYGADYANSAKVDAELYRNAKIPNRQNGIGDDLARKLMDWGFLDGDIDSYEDLREKDQEAADLIERALGGERVYRLEDLEAVDKFDRYKEAVAMAEDALGGRIEEYRRVLDIIKGLKLEGYRPVSSADIELVAQKLEELGELAAEAKEAALKPQIANARQQAEEWKEAAQRRLKELAHARAEARQELQEQADREYSGALDLSIPLDSAPVADLTGAEISSEKLDIKTLRKKAMEFFDKTFRGKKAENKKIGEVDLYKSGAREIVRTTSNETKIKMLPAVKDIIEKGVLVKERAAENRKDNIVKFYYLQAKIKLEGKERFAQVDVAETKDGKRLYYLNDITPKKEKGASSVPDQVLPYNPSIAKKLDEINNQAQGIKKAVISEINKREIENKRELLNELQGAKDAQSVFAAAEKLLDNLRKEYEKTDEGQAEKRKLDVPSTNWDEKKILLLKDLNDLLQNQDEKTRRAQALLKEESRAKLNYRAALSEEEKAAVQRAKAFLKENYTPRIIRLLERALRAEEHLYPKDINRMIAHTAGMITNFNNTLKMQLDGFIRWAETAQRENYNRYIWRKLDGLIGRRQFEKSGNVKKAKYGQTAMAFLKAAKEIWDLTPQNAEIKLQAQMNKSFENFEKNEATDIKDVLLNRVLEFKIKGKDNNPQASRRTLDEVQALLQIGRSAVLNKNIRKQLARDYMREAVKQAILHRKYPKGAKWFLTLSDTNYTEFIKNALGTFEFDEVDPQTGAVAKRKIDFAEEFDTLSGQVKTGVYKYQKGNEINNIFRRTLGISGHNAMLNKIAELQKPVYKAENYMRRANEMDGKAQVMLLKDGKWLTSDTHDIDELNKLEIMSIYEWYKNTLPDPQSGNDYGLRGRLLRQYGQAQLDEMFGLLSREEIALADSLQKFVANQWKEENEVFSELHGFSLPQDPDYLPSVARRMDIGGDVDFMREYAANTKNPSFVHQRVKSFRVAMKPTSILTIAQNHTNRAGEYINEAIPFTEIKAVLKNETVERAFETAFGQAEGQKVYNKLLRLIDLQAPQKAKTAGALSKAMEFVFNGWVKAAMALKTTIGIKQFATGVSFAEKMPFDLWAKYFIEGLANAKHTRDFMLENVPNIGVRFAQGNISESVQRAMASRDVNLYATKWNNFTNLLMLNIRLGDAGSFIYGGYPYYKYLTQDLKMPPEAARREFTAQGEGTLQSSQKALLGEYQANAGNYLARTWVVFRNQPKQFFSRLVTSYIQFKNGEISAAQFGKVWLIYAFANPMIYEMLGLAWLFGGDDDDDKKEKTKRGLFSVLSSPLTGLANVNVFADTAIRYLLDAAYNKSQGEKLPAPQNLKIPAFDDIRRDIASAVSAYNKAGDMETLLNNMTVTDFIDSLAAMVKYTGLPAQTMLNIAGGVKDIAKGEGLRGALRIAGYTEYRAGEITGLPKERAKKRKVKKTKRKKDRR